MGYCPCNGWIPLEQIWEGKMKTISPRSATHCPKCDKPYDSYDVVYSRHHIIPRRHFPGSNYTIDICRYCHNALERLIPYSRKLPISTYYLIVNNFLGYHAVTAPEENKKYGQARFIHH